MKHFIHFTGPLVLTLVALTSSVPSTLAVDCDCAAVKLREMPNYRKAEAQSAVASPAGGVRLPKSIEHVGEELCVDAFTGVFDAEDNVISGLLQRNFNHSVPRRELYRIR